MGVHYETSFNAYLSDLAAKYRSAEYPFFSRRVTEIRILQLSDGMHPNASGNQQMVENFHSRAEAILACHSKPKRSARPAENLKSSACPHAVLIRLDET